MNLSCFQSLAEYDEMLKYVNEVRAQLSVVNFAENDTETQPFEPTPFSVYFVRLPLYMLIMLVSLIGNGLVIVVICSNRSMLSKPTNYLMLNLAVCDLLILVSCVWVEMVASVNRLWILSELFCKLNSYMQIASIVASVWTLVAITCDRFMAVMRPLRSHSTRTKNIVFIVLIWLFSFGIAVPSYMYRRLIRIQWSDYVEAYCDDLDWPVELVEDEHGCSRATQPGKRIYYTSLIVMMFFVPMLVMVVAYSIVIGHLGRHEELIGEHAHSTHSNHSHQAKNKKKTILMLLRIILVFFACWSPLEGMLLFVEYSAGPPAWWPRVEWIAYMLAYASTAINPFIYVGMSENYQLAFRRMRVRFLLRLFGATKRREKESRASSLDITQVESMRLSIL